jgi:TRAP-type C4-dicarboxylate transport system permease small subunit
MAAWQRGLDLLAQIATALASVMIVVLIVIFGWLVYGRYILNATPTWVEQAALLMVVWITFLGAAVGVRRKTHLSVDFIRDALPGPLRGAALIIASCALLFFGAMLAWQGYVMFDRTARRDIPLIGISEGWRAVPVIIGGTMIFLFSLDDLARRVFRKEDTA